MQRSIQTRGPTHKSQTTDISHHKSVLSHQRMTANRLVNTAEELSDAANGDMPLICDYTRHFVWHLMKSRFYMKYIGCENVPEGGAIYASSHPCSLEVAMIPGLPGKPRPVGTGHFGRLTGCLNQTAHQAIRCGGAILTTGGHVTDQMAALMNREQKVWIAVMGKRHPNVRVSVATQVENAGFINSFFDPERDISTDFNHQGMYTGAVVAALKARKPIIPMVFKGTKYAEDNMFTATLPTMAAIIGKPLNIEIGDLEYLEQIDPGEYLPEPLILKYAQRLADAINQLSDQTGLSDDEPFECS